MNERLQNWPEHLAEWVEEVRDLPFAWGVWDCAIAASQAVTRITGDADPLDGLRWEGIREALRLIESEGGLEAATTKRLGEPIAPAFAQRGDVVLIEQTIDEGEQPQLVLAVCLSGDCCGPTARGLRFRPMTEALMAWKIGR